MLTDAHQISLIQTTSQPVKISDLLSAFLSGRSPRTLKAYSQDLADFHCFSKVTTTEDAARGLLSQAHGRANLLPLEYQTSLTERGLQSATINRRLAAVWSLDIQNVRTEAYRDTKGPGKSGFRAMLQTLAEKKSKKTIRDTAILRLLYDLALRTGETVALDYEDVEPGRSVIHVLGKGKTDKQQLTVPESTKAALDAWLQIRGTEPGALFHNLDRAKKGKRLSAVAKPCSVLPVTRKP